MTYTYSATQDNGRIVSSADGVTGENVSYTYDSLNRLIAAATSGTTGVQWGDSYSYDGFGNLTSKVVTKGTAPQVYPQVNSATNQARMSGDYGFDVNGNWLGSGGSQINTWNVENQLISNGSVDYGGNLLTYTYDPWGKRVLQYSVGGGSGPTGTLYFYSITGQRLGIYTLNYLAGTQTSVNMYFGGRLLAAVDRLGSVRGNRNGAIAYYPWGEERTATPAGNDKFATYFRDSSVAGVGEDYASARYYNNNFGRFWSPDPFRHGKLRRPQTWNQYLYAGNDPVNRYDPDGTDDGGPTYGGPAILAGDDSEPDGDSEFVFGPCIFSILTLGCPQGQTGPGSGGSRTAVLPLVMKDEWYQGLALADKMLSTEPDCAGLFGLVGWGGNESPEALAVLSQISNSYQFGPIGSAANTVTSATTTGNGSTSLPVGDGSVFVNTSVTITLNNTTSGASFVNGYVYDWAVTILHELGHAYWDLYGPGTSLIGPDNVPTNTNAQNLQLSEANTALVEQNCPPPGH